MSGVKGIMYSCCRCDEKIFLKYIGKGETDGGYTTWDKYEELPDDWLYETEFGHLCPKCARGFREFVTRYFDGKVPPKWRAEASGEGR